MKTKVPVGYIPLFPKIKIDCEGGDKSSLDQYCDVKILFCTSGTIGNTKKSPLPG